MPYQKQINAYPAAGVAGDKANLNTHVYTTRNYFAEGPVTVGNFVWEGTDPERQATATGSADKNLIGIVERIICYWDPDIFSGGTLTVPDKTEITVCVKGDYKAATTTEATYGQAVFATLAGGAPVYGTAGGTVEGAIETPWVVKGAAPAGEVALISNWSVK